MFSAGHIANVKRAILMSYLVSLRKFGFSTKLLSNSSHRHLILLMFFSAFLISPFKSSCQTDTLICDNGGFEDDFDYYFGDTSALFEFRQGSGSCTPLNSSNNPISFYPSSMPVLRTFAIVGTGYDAITGFPQVLFDEKALLISNQLPHFDIGNPCIYGRAVDRVTKKFRVTEANRNFTVWYAAVIHNPADHSDDQPFFNIHCDRASSADLCFDGLSFQANSTYPTGECLDGEEIVKSSAWACHRVFIPRSSIGQIATLEITVADCGQSGHFGYAYIDGICEPCSGSSYGSGTISQNTPSLRISCNGDSITITGSYTEPSIDGGYTILDDFIVPGFSIYDKTINTTAKTFSFKIIKSDFESPNPDCSDVIAYLQFKNSSNDFLPDIPTNALEVCYEDFVIPELDVTIGDCNRNDPTNTLISDDYYYVNVDISEAAYISWSLERQLDDPLPDESGHYTLKTSVGNGNYNLGPFLIQEGSWILIFNHNNCSDTFQITPPAFCSGCTQLSRIKISNIQCNPTNGYWSYDIMVPYQSPPTGSCFKISNFGSYAFNTTYTIVVGSVSDFCITRTIGYYSTCSDLLPVCTILVDICPPKPCNDDNYDECDLEVYVNKIYCESDGHGGYTYSVDFDISGASYVCYKMGGTCASGCHFTNPLGPLTSDVTITFYSCSTPSTCDCPSTGCYKTIKVHEPMDCDTREGYNRSTSRTKFTPIDEVAIYPNPVLSDEFLIKSTLNMTEFEIVNSSGQLMYSNVFKGSELLLNIKIPSGLYLLRYKNNDGEYKVFKFVKL